MTKIAVLSAKGGAGKTTVAINLAVSAEHAGHATVLIDLDPQASACRWQDVREDDTPAVVSAHAARLPQLLPDSERALKRSDDVPNVIVT